MTTYSKSEDRELNRRIAELRGHRIEWRDDIREYAPYGEGSYIDGVFHSGFVEIRPDDKPDTVYTIDTEGYDTADEAWNTVPRWSRDIDEAMELLNERRSFIIYKNTYTDENGKERIDYSVGIEGTTPEHHTTSLPRAIALAWLSWREANHG